MDLEHQVEGGICRLTLNRPDAGNALTPAQRDEMIAILDAASGDLGIRVVVISSAPPGATSARAPTSGPTAAAVPPAPRARPSGRPAPSPG
jgi:2-(1,2-epoxy-1,2-dihydrophenyl)acetyl-CoA isomerase